LRKVANIGLARLSRRRGRCRALLPGGKKFDLDGAYVRRWVPELAELPARLIHQPWTATPLELASAGIILGTTYPEPIIDHKAGRERALADYAKVRAG
jgi:deoxyribodipyrimidine photo-lyase